MSLKLERWGVEVNAGNLTIRLVSGDFFIRVPMIGQVAWNSTGLYMDRWADAKHDPVL